MIIGPSKSGKTTIANYINNYKGPLKRVADVIYSNETIDVPSSYIENSSMYKHIIALAQDAKKILILVDQSNCTEVYSQGFALSFSCEVIGAITKADIACGNREKCLKQLKKIGVIEPYFIIDSNDEQGISRLKEYLL